MDDNLQFFKELKLIAVKLENLLDKHDVREKAVSIFSVGLIEEIDEDRAKMRVMHTFNICDESEIDELCELVKEEFKKQKNQSDDGYDEDLGFFLN
jgi:hypothetical protein